MISCWKSLVIIVTLITTWDSSTSEQIKHRCRSRSSIYETVLNPSNCKENTIEDKVNIASKSFNNFFGNEWRPYLDRKYSFNTNKSPLDTHCELQGTVKHSLSKRDCHKNKWAHSCLKRCANSKKIYRLPRQIIKGYQKLKLGPLQNIHVLKLTFPNSLIKANMSSKDFEKSPELKWLASLLTEKVHPTGCILFNNVTKSAGLTTMDTLCTQSNILNKYVPQTSGKYNEMVSKNLHTCSNMMSSNSDHSFRTPSNKLVTMAENKGIENAKILNVRKIPYTSYAVYTKHKFGCSTQRYVTAPPLAHCVLKLPTDSHDFGQTLSPFPVYESNFPTPTGTYSQPQTLPWSLKKLDHNQRVGLCSNNKFYRPTIMTTCKIRCYGQTRRVFYPALGPTPCPPESYYCVTNPSSAQCIIYPPTMPCNTNSPTTAQCPMFPPTFQYASNPSLVQTKKVLVSPPKEEQGIEVLFLTPPPGAQVIACTDPNCKKMETPKTPLTSILVPPPREMSLGSHYQSIPKGSGEPKERNVKSLIDQIKSQVKMLSKNEKIGAAGKNIYELFNSGTLNGLTNTNIRGNAEAYRARNKLGNGGNSMKSWQNWLAFLGTLKGGYADTGLDKPMEEKTGNKKHLAPLGQLDAHMKKRHSEIGNGGNMDKKEALKTLKKIEDELKALQTALCFSKETQRPLESNLTLQIKVFLDITKGNNTCVTSAR